MFIGPGHLLFQVADALHKVSMWFVSELFIMLHTLFPITYLFYMN